jgi:diguanylate cyclase (GGDEF)-like protein
VLSRRARLRAWALIASIVAVAAVSLPLFDGSRPTLPLSHPLPRLFVLFVVAYACPLKFTIRKARHEIVIVALVLVLGLFFLTPVELVSVSVIANLATSAVQRVSVTIAAFNAANTALPLVASIAVFHLTTPSNAAHASAWPAALFAIVVDDLSSLLLLSLLGRARGTTYEWRELGRLLLFALVTDLLIGCFGLISANAIAFNAASTWLVTLLVVLALLALQWYHGIAEHYTIVDRLYAAAKDAQPVTISSSGLAPILIAFQEVLLLPALGFVSSGNNAFALTATGGGEDPVVVSEQPAYEESTSTDQAFFTHRISLVRRVLGRHRHDIRVDVTLGRANDSVGQLVATGAPDRALARADHRSLAAAAQYLGEALEKGQLVEGLREATARDNLTGLANLETLRNVLSTMLDEGSDGVVLLADIDRFHDINDTLGHDSGDAVLVDVARRLEAAANSGSLVARVGSDRFVIVIPGSSSSELSRLAAVAVKSKVDGRTQADAIAADIRITIGMARAPDHGEDAITLLRRAEIAMVTAKGTPSGIAEWEASMESDGTRRLNVLSGLREAIVNADLTVEYQPKISLSTGEVHGLEALVRWRHDELGMVPPSEFIPLAETSGLIQALTTTVLRTALETCRRWHDAGMPVGMSVNISARSLDDQSLVGQVAAMLAESGVDSRYLTLEITESSVMENPTRSREVLRQLRSLGCRLSIDDFGTGYSSLYYVRGLPVHEVKIDKTFVDHVATDGADRAVIRAVVELCDSLGLTTVAEGVEHAAQAEALAGLGVNEVQGFFYSRPMPEGPSAAWLRRRRIASGYATAPAQRQGEDAQRG